MRSKEELMPVIEAYEKELIEKYGELIFNEQVELDKSSLLNFIISYFKEVRNTEHKNLLTCSVIDPNYKSEYFRDRSIGDLFLIAKSNYDNNVTLLEVMEVMYYIVETREPVCNSTISPHYAKIYICGDIHKYVFWMSSTKSYPMYEYSDYAPGKYNDLEFDIQSADYVTLFK